MHGLRLYIVYEQCFIVNRECTHASEFAEFSFRPRASCGARTRNLSYAALLHKMKIDVTNARVGHAFVLAPPCAIAQPH